MNRHQHLGFNREKHRPAYFPLFCLCPASDEWNPCGHVVYGSCCVSPGSAGLNRCQIGICFNTLGKHFV